MPESPTHRPTIQRIAQSIWSFIWRWRCAFYYPLLSLCLTLPLFYSLSLAYIHPTVVRMEKDRASRLCTAIAEGTKGLATPGATLINLGPSLSTIGYQYCLTSSALPPSPSLCPQTLPPDRVSCTLTLSGGSLATLSLYPDGNTLPMTGWIPRATNIILILLPILLAVVIASLAAITGYMRARVRMSFDELEKEAIHLRSLMVRQYELIDFLGTAQGRGSDGNKRSSPPTGPAGGPPRRMDSEGAQDLLAKVQSARQHLQESGLESLTMKDEIVLIDRLPGSSGDVFKGTWRGSTVAVKSLVLPSILTGRQQAASVSRLEAAVTSSVPHPHIAQLYTYSIKVTRDKGRIALADQAAREEGVNLPSGLTRIEHLQPSSADSYRTRGGPPEANESIELLLCLEYCDCGTLRDMLNKGTFLDGDGLNYPAIVATALDVARGMVHLHDHDTVLGDLTPSNVWLKRDYGDGRGVAAKVADFGHSFQLHSSPHVVAKDESFHGRMTHSAPEAILEGKLSKASDVYSFGILLYELFTSSPPFDTSLDPFSLVQLIAIDGRRPNFPLVVPHGYRSLAESCWRQDPEERPRFEFIVDRLVDLKSCLRGPMRPLKKITLLADMVHKSQINMERSVSKKSSFSKQSLDSGIRKADEEEEDGKEGEGESLNPTGRQRQVRRNKSAALLVTFKSPTSGDQPKDKETMSERSRSKGWFISGAISPQPSPKHSPPLPSPAHLDLMMKTSPNILSPFPHLPSSMTRATSGPPPSSLSPTGRHHHYTPSESSLPAAGTNDLRTMKSNPTPLAITQRSTSSHGPLTSSSRGEGFEEGDVLASLFSSLVSTPSPLHDLPSPKPYEASASPPPSGQPLGLGGVEAARNGWEDEEEEDGPGIVLGPGTVLSAEGAFLPDDPPASSPTLTGSEGQPGAFIVPGKRRMGAVEKAVARMKGISVRRSTTCSMETIEEVPSEGDGIVTPHDPLYDSRGPRSTLMSPSAGQQATTSSGPQDPARPSPSMAAAVASVQGTLSAHETLIEAKEITSSLGALGQEISMSDNQIQTLLQQRAHREVMESRRSGEGDHPMVVIGSATSLALQLAYIQAGLGESSSGRGRPHSQDKGKANEATAGSGGKS